jgi:hypothetical protein
VAPLVADRDGGMLDRFGFIFLSAPDSTTPSHTDPEHNFPLQVRQEGPERRAISPIHARSSWRWRIPWGGGHPQR